MNCQNFWKLTKILLIYKKKGLSTLQKVRKCHNTQFLTGTVCHFAFILPEHLKLNTYTIHMFIHFSISSVVMLLLLPQAKPLCSEALRISKLRGSDFYKWDGSA